MGSYVQEDFKGLDSIVARIRMKAVGALNSAADSTAHVAKELAPVSTEETRPGGPHGELRDSIAVKQYATPENMTAIVEAAAPHAVYVERGTIYMDAQPYMAPAFESGKKQLKDELRTGGIGSGVGIHLGTELGSRFESEE